MIPEAAVTAAWIEADLPDEVTKDVARRMIEAAAPHILAEAATKAPKHQCEPWQVQVNSSGTFRYCAACGEPTP